MNSPMLKLRAEDQADIQVLSAILQDAIAPVCDIAYNAAEKVFMLVVHRFCWDEPPETIEEMQNYCFERICCALEIRGVEAVQRHGINQEDTAQMLDLLTIILDGENLDFIFAGGAELKLKLKDWILRLEDFGEAWPTTHRPSHIA